MLKELINELTEFARKNNFHFDYEFNDKLKDHSFRFQNQAQSWGYCRVISDDQLNQSAFSATYFAQSIIRTLNEKLEQWGAY